MSLSSWSSQSSPAMFPSPSKRLVKSNSGLRIVSQHERGNAPWALEEPHWVKDHEHHCRRCGQIFCSKCCQSKIQFHRMGFVDPVRNCQTCSPLTRKEEIFFTNQLKVLFQGAPFHVRSSMAISLDSCLYNCRISNDERYLLFNNHGDEGEQIHPIDLCRISSIEILSEGNMMLTAKEMTSSEFTLEIQAPAEPSRKPSLAWLKSFEQGMGFVFNSRESSLDQSPASSAESPQNSDVPPSDE
ncbi:hypothetical protein TCAL_09464 [Tigriopus californicus]|uniref:FYVE-type domain-containing protein n=1 Tax=Tigriopus californicus TaxID=6832 RepID=A0A553PM60_TIGCA|nr:hypothetical protein TCAL_09464 [Tigriopus californicus]|eukprot:TCALIF_09464-PA protein Name:"Similar to ZFYVE21 Zinc finger FYVE domain-containing protein 21 (Homo sapiens)" AED:0.08 eAED:0.08 QI:0/0.66/0.75/0.75/1/1/4/739/241